MKQSCREFSPERNDCHFENYKQMKISNLQKRFFPFFVMLISIVMIGGLLFVDAVIAATDCTAQMDIWHHVAAVWSNDGTPDVTDVMLYVDGILEDIC